MTSKILYILFISPEPWRSNSVSKHHYARELARRGCKVYFLNPPVDSVDGFCVEQIEESANLFEVNTSQVAKGLRFYPKLLRQRLEARFLIQLEDYVNVKFDVIWLFENSRFYDLSFAENRLKIYHQVDLNQDFHVETAARTADICFATTDFISNRLLKFNKRVFKIHHGVSILAKSVQLTTDMAVRFTNGKVHAAYIGNLDISYLDILLLLELVRGFPDVMFHFVGNYKLDGQLYSVCSDARNVVWWGAVSSTLIPSILEHCDVLLVTYLAEVYKEQLASPHKMMEYMGSGKTIVATYTDEYKDKRHLLEMVDRSSDFIGAFERVIGNLDGYNCTDKMASRIAYANENSYEKQIDNIFNLLSKNGLDKQ